MQGIMNQKQTSIIFRFVYAIENDILMVIVDKTKTISVPLLLANLLRT